jgi:hypothetical protein
VSVFRRDVEDKDKGSGPMIPCACGCGKLLQQFDGRNRERMYLQGHNVKALFARPK